MKLKKRFKDALTAFNLNGRWFAPFQIEDDYEGFKSRFRYEFKRFGEDAESELEKFTLKYFEPSKQSNRNTSKSDTGHME